VLSLKNFLYYKGCDNKMRWPRYAFTMLMSGVFIGLGFSTVINSIILGLILFTLGVMLFLYGYSGK